VKYLYFCLDHSFKVEKKVRPTVDDSPDTLRGYTDGASGFIEALQLSKIIHWKLKYNSRLSFESFHSLKLATLGAKIEEFVVP
jgi:hypothetical protein